MTLTVENYPLYIILAVQFIAISLLTILYRKTYIKLIKTQQTLGSIRIVPHFIFNALNLLQQDILKQDRRSANKFLSRFSKLTRSILENSFRDYIPLKEELSQIKEYLRIEAMRFETPFRYEIMLSDSIDTSNTHIPPMMIQPFVENAIWHGLLPKKEGELVLLIKAEKAKRSILLSIEDNGVGMNKLEITDPGKNGESKGIQIVHQRIQNLNKIHRKKYRIKFINMHRVKDLTGTIVEIRIPLIEMHHDGESKTDGR